MKRRIYTGWFK